MPSKLYHGFSFALSGSEQARGEERTGKRHPSLVFALVWFPFFSDFNSFLVACCFGHADGCSHKQAQRAKLQFICQFLGTQFLQWQHLLPNFVNQNQFLDFWECISINCGAPLFKFILNCIWLQISTKWTR